MLESAQRFSRKPQRKGTSALCLLCSLVKVAFQCDGEEDLWWKTKQPTSIVFPPSFFLVSWYWPPGTTRKWPTLAGPVLASEGKQIHNCGSEESEWQRERERDWKAIAAEREERAPALSSSSPLPHPTLPAARCPLPSQFKLPTPKSLTTIPHPRPKRLSSYITINHPLCTRLSSIIPVFCPCHHSPLLLNPLPAAPLSVQTPNSKSTFSLPMSPTGTFLRTPRKTCSMPSFIEGPLHPTSTIIATGRA